VQEVQACLTACAAAPSNMLVASELATKMEEGRGLMTLAHPEASKLMMVILHHYDKGSETASEPNEWRKLYQELVGCLGEVEKDMGLLDMGVTHATVTLPPGVAIRQLFTHFAFNPISSMPALQVNICQALDIHPVGMQWCAVQAGGGFKLQGLQGEAPLFYLSLWEPLAQALRSRLAFTGNTATFDFTSLTGKGIKARIKLLVDKTQTRESPGNLVQEMEQMRGAFDKGIAIFVPATTQKGEAIQANTTLNDLQQLSEEEKQARPFDIRVWNREDGNAERRLQTLQMLIRDDKVSLVVSANEIQRDWVVYMAHAYATAINDCAARKLFDWNEVQQGMDIQDLVAGVLQITFSEFLNEHTIGGVYCSRDTAPVEDQDEEMNIDDQLTRDLATMPRSIQVLGKNHPFVSVDQGRMAGCILAKLVEAGSIKIIKKGGAGIIVTEPLYGLVNTIRECTVHAMSPATTIKWREIPMSGSDLKQLTEDVKEHLRRTNFVWLFAGPGQLIAPPIPELDMQDQEREQEAFTVCKLNKRDARFCVGTWTFEAIHILAAEGRVAIQKVVNRKTQRTGYMVISPDAERTFEDQYGPVVTALSRLKTTKLGDDEQAREQLLELEIGWLESLLEEASDKILVVTGAKSAEEGFKFTEGQMRGDPEADIDLVTRGLARKSEEHKRATIYQIRTQGKKVLDIQGGILLVPPGHALATWDPKDARLSGWHPSRPLEELLEVVRAMDLDPSRGGEQSSLEAPPIQRQQDQSTQGEDVSWADLAESADRQRSDQAEKQSTAPAESVRMECSWLSELHKRPAQDMAKASEAMRVLRAKESNDPQLLRAVEANANNTYSVEFEAMNATLENENEWMTKAEATGPITFKIQLAQKARVVGLWLLHGTHGKLFTQVEVKVMGGHQKSTMVIIPQEAGNKAHYTWLQQPIYGQQFELIFNADSTQGTSGSAGLKFVALAGWATSSGQAKGLPTASETSCEPGAAQNVSDEGERSQRRKL